MMRSADGSGGVRPGSWAGSWPGSWVGVWSGLWFGLRSGVWVGLWSGLWFGLRFGLCAEPVAGLVLAPMSISAPPAADRPAPLIVPRVALRVSPGDSLELHRKARELQRRFEDFRRNHLPLRNGGGGGECDDVVGRMCWYHVTGSLWLPDPEHPGITSERSRLLAGLAELADSLPGDGWLLGQRVFYLVEAGEPTEARELARLCGDVEPWWCEALEGFALHALGRHASAEAAYRSALQSMPTELRTEWTDVDVLLDGRSRRLFRDAERAGEEGGALIRLTERLWRLADPLLLTPGNERWTEHMSRQVEIRVRAEARNPHGIPWGRDLGELLLRYGGEIAWERTLPESSAFLSSAGVLGHERPDGRSYLPPGEVLEDPSSVAPESWVAGTRYTASAYTPALAPVVLPLAGTTAVFPRGEHAVVAARYQLPRDTTLRTRRDARLPYRAPDGIDRVAQAGLFLVPLGGSGAFDILESRSSSSTRGSLMLEAPVGSYWLSVEVWDPEIGRAGRARHGLRITPSQPDLPVLSDLLLLEPGPEPSRLEEALPRWRPDDRLTPDDSLMVGWELWGLGFRDEALSYQLSVHESEGGFFERAGRWMGLVGDLHSVVLEWSEPSQEDPGPVFRAVGLRLPELEPGSYGLRLELRTAGRDPVVSERLIEVGGF